MTKETSIPLERKSSDLAAILDLASAFCLIAEQKAHPHQLPPLREAITHIAKLVSHQQQQVELGRRIVAYVVEDIARQQQQVEIWRQTWRPWLAKGFRQTARYYDRLADSYAVSLQPIPCRTKRGRPQDTHVYRTREEFLSACSRKAQSHFQRFGKLPIQEEMARAAGLSLTGFKTTMKRLQLNWNFLKSFLRNFPPFK